MAKAKTTIFTFSVLFFYACGQLPNGPVEGKENDRLPAIDTLVEQTNLPWADDIIECYLINNIERLPTNKTFPLTYIKEFQTIDDKEYIKVSIGYSLPLRFETRQLIFLDTVTHQALEHDHLSGNLNHWPDQFSAKLEIPTAGIYSYDVAFAEWGGKSMGEKVTVLIDGENVKVTSWGEHSAFGTPGQLIEEGLLKMHASGRWIIAVEASDVYAKEIGGCTGGPTILDFEAKSYETC